MIDLNTVAQAMPLIEKALILEASRIYVGFAYIKETRTDRYILDILLQGEGYNFKFRMSELNEGLILTKELIADAFVENYRKEASRKLLGGRVV